MKAILQSTICVGIGLVVGTIILKSQVPTLQPYNIPAVHQQVDLWHTTCQPCTLSSQPVSNTIVNIYLNGLLMDPTSDYKLVGSTITWTGQKIGAMVNPTIQVIYWAS